MPSTCVHARTTSANAYYPLRSLDDAMNAQATPNARTQGFENGYCGVSNVELHNVAGVGGFYPVFIGSCIEC